MKQLLIALALLTATVGYANPHNGGSNDQAVDVDTTVVAGAAANSSSSSNSGGNSLSVHTGRSTSGASATGGFASAAGGDAVSSSSIHDVEGGNAVATGGAAGDSSASSGGNSFTVRGDVHEVAASSAASVFAGYCQTGVSGQIEQGGFSIVHTEQFCNHVRLADVMYQAYTREVVCTCEGACTAKEASVERVCSTSDEGQLFLDAYYDNLLDAQSLIEVTEGTSKLDAIAKQLTTPLGLIGALIWLL